ncbi:hypothetical protein BH11ACT6_BH11ACT6_17200 [soil metagenome]
MRLRNTSVRLRARLEFNGGRHCRSADEGRLTNWVGNGTRFEFECYDISHLNNLAHFHGRGLARGPLFVQSVFGLLGGIGAHPEDLMHMRRHADRLLSEDYQLSILGAGKN